MTSVQSLSCVRLFATPWNTARQASLSISNSQSLLKLMSMESVMPSNRLILCRPLLLPPSIFPSIRVFSNESALRIRWPKYRSFNFREFSSFRKSFCCFCVFLITASPFTLRFPGRHNPWTPLRHHSTEQNVYTKPHFCSQTSNPHLLQRQADSLPSEPPGKAPCMAESPQKVKVKVAHSCLFDCDSMDCPWNSPGQTTGVHSLSLLQGVFPTQRSNPGLSHCRRILCQLSHKNHSLKVDKVSTGPLCIRDTQAPSAETSNTFPEIFVIRHCASCSRNL